MGLFAGFASDFLFGQEVSGSGNGIKKALCIGIAHYVDRPLKNPTNDAKLVGSALRDLGFNVTLVLDSNLEAMRKAFRTFFDQVREAEAAFIFYAGHGFEVNGTNYLIPSDTNPSAISSNNIAQVAISMRYLTTELERTNAKVRVVVIDACRDTPKRGATLTMQQMVAKGTLIAFSTSPGNFAEDSMAGLKTGNSPYSFALAESMRNRELTLKEMFNRAHSTVAVLTQERQIPWVHDGMTGDFRLYDSKTIISSAAVSSSQLVINSRSRSRGSDAENKSSESSGKDEIDQAPREMSPRSAREKLKILGYSGSDISIARKIILSVDVESADLCLIAGIKLRFASDRGDFYVPTRIVKEHSQRVSLLLPKIKSSGVDIDEKGDVGFYLSEAKHKDISGRPFDLIKGLKKFGIQYPEDVSLEFGVATYDFELSLLSYAIWIKKYDVVRALLNSGASLNSEIVAIGWDLNLKRKRFKVSTSGDELRLIDLKV